jgi:hypothetical protein
MSLETLQVELDELETRYDELESERDSLRAQLATAIAERDEADRVVRKACTAMDCEPVGDDDFVEAVRLLVKERDEAREGWREAKVHTERAAEISAVEAKVSAFATQVCDSVAKERDAAIARAEQAEAERDAWMRTAGDYAKTIGTQHESVARIEARVAEQVATWLDTWEPDYYADAADNEAMTTSAVLTLAVDRIRRGDWREKASE